MPPADADHLTWTVLLARWVEFAQSAVALPRQGKGGKLRASVPDIIMLQAVWFALQHLSELETDERALGLDRADVLIEKHTAHLHQLWTGETIPETLAELIHDAQQALTQARAVPKRGEG